MTLLKLLSAVSLLLLCLLMPIPAPAQAEYPAQRVVETACTQCHGLGWISNLRDGVTGWRETVQEMVMRGAQLTPSEVEAVTAYLAQHYGPGQEPMKTGALPLDAALQHDDTLPDGDGKDLVRGRCQMCHDLGRIVSLRRSNEDWERMTRNMINRGIPASDEELAIMVSYLATHFGNEK